MATFIAEMSEFHESTGSYSLDALEAAERAEFEAHLATCRPCRDEVVRLRETVAELSVLSVATPPPRLCGDVLDAALTTPRNPARDEVVTDPDP
jgi:anti-sigma factor RsiW